MKYLFLIIVFMFIGSCACPECVNIPENIRVAYVNEDGENLLVTNQVRPLKAKFCNTNTNLKFITNTIVVDNSGEKTHLEFVSEKINENCKSRQCCILIKFEDNSPDTLLYKLLKTSSKCCTSYSVSTFDYNGIDYLGKQDDITGAYVITKKD